MPYLIDGHNLIPKLGLRLDELDDEIELIRRKMSSEESFESPSWGMFQAYQLGRMKELDRLKAFIPETGK